MSIRGPVIEFAASLRKKFSMETVSSLSLRNLYVPAFVELLRVHGPEKTVKTFFRWGFQMGHDFMLELKRDAERIRMHDLEERKTMARIAWYTFLGRKPEVEVRWEEIAGEKVLFLRIVERDSPLVRGVTLAEKLPLCAYAAGAYEGASQTVFALQGREFFVLAREVRCKAAGDDFCEVVLVDIPSDRLDDIAPKIEEKVPSFYKHIDLDFSKSLREIVTL